MPVSDEIKQQAIELRQQGKTYPEISSALDGAVSVDWCKKNLKGVVILKQRETLYDLCLVELISLATRPEGCSDTEARDVVLKHHPEASYEKICYLKKRSKALNSGCLYRPDWIDPSSPKESHEAINAYAIHLMDEIDNLVSSYLQSFPQSSEWAVKYELLKLTCPSLISSQPLSKRIVRNESVAEALEDRISPSP